MSNRNAEDLEPGWYWANFADKYGKDHGDWEVVLIKAGNLYRAGHVGRNAKYYHDMEFTKVTREQE